MTAQADRPPRWRRMAGATLAVVAVAALVAIPLAHTRDVSAPAVAYGYPSLPGDLDTTFGVGGKVTSNFLADDAAQAVVIQSNGKILAAGATNLPPSNFALARYRLDGVLDTTFDGDGKAVTDLGGDDSAADVAIQPDDGKIVVGGGTTGDFALARYNLDGSLDTSFGAGGKVTTDFGANDGAGGIALLPDGRIVAAGWTGTSGAFDFAVARYDADGTLDATFDGDGKVVVDMGGVDFAADVAIQSDGKIVVAGEDGSGFALARLDVDGSLDTQGLDPALDGAFGVGGRVTTDFTGSPDGARAVAIGSGGRIIAAGSTTIGDFALARYRVDGSLDETFGGDGKVTTSFTAGPDRDVAADLALQPDGWIVVAGSAGFQTASADFALARYAGGTNCCGVAGLPGG